jgi:hypothetical protein
MNAGSHKLNVAVAMNSLRMFLFVGVLLTPIIPTLAAQAQTVEKESLREPIGVATMNDDGTIVLRLRAKTPHGGLGEGTLVYPPSHPQYQSILSHIGPISKGQTVSVKPWPD